ncbi:BnaC02g19150D [Brassica napus]|uniref:BnaC02g19150D protein n=1 Tax=Brassica napus TaxID=3708 RepID=A0A078GSS7_BRANA|nr:BnaC02g19150D [Brassica napus]
MGRWRAVTALLLLRHNQILNSLKPSSPRVWKHPATRFHHRLLDLRPFSAFPSPISIYNNDSDSGSSDVYQNYDFRTKEEEDKGKITVKAYFLSTSIDLKGMQADNLCYVVPPTSRSTNSIALKFSDSSSGFSSLDERESVSSCRFMVVFQYGSAVLFNVDDNMTLSLFSTLFVDMLLGCLQKSEKMIMLIRIIGSVLGQSIALDYFVSQVDKLVQEFAGINRGMEKTGTFTMHRKKLFQLVGKANSNLADVILRVGLFDRSEIAWREARYAQIYEYLREEYEVTQRFGNLDFKLKFVEHNIHFLQEVMQNRKSDLLEWCIIFLLTIENVLSIYGIVRESTGVSLL